jgi:hypothetical protein
MIDITLGPYQTTSQLGKGSIGEDYRAQDQKLDTQGRSVDRRESGWYSDGEVTKAG